MRVSKVRIIERNGHTVGQMLMNKSPWKKSKCQNQECVPCVNDPGSCRKRNCVYKIVCVNCALHSVSTIYIGETHRTYADRNFEHTQAIKSLNTAYATVKHHLEHHSDREPHFTFHFVASYQSSLERQIRESLAIENINCDIPMNLKGEWGGNNIPRATYEATDKPTFNIPIQHRQHSEQQTSATQDQKATTSSLQATFHQRKKRKRELQNENVNENAQNAETSLSQPNLATNKAGNIPSNIQPSNMATGMIKCKATECSNMRKDETTVQKRKVQQRLIFEKGRLIYHSKSQNREKKK